MPRPEWPASRALAQLQLQPNRSTTISPSSAFPSSAQRRDTLLAAAPPDGSPSLSLRVGSCTARTTDKRRLPRGSRPAPGSRRLSHIRQIAEFSLPCLGVYLWLRTQDYLTPATFRLPHPRPSARRGSIPLVRFPTTIKWWARQMCRVVSFSGVGGEGRWRRPPRGLLRQAFRIAWRGAA